MSEASAKWNREHPERNSAAQRRYRARNKEKMRIKQREWRANHLTEMREEYHRAYIQDRNKVFDHYGWSCQCCGESHSEFLSIDHINGNGVKHLKAIGIKFYRWLVVNNFPSGFQTLCMNCNCAKGRNGGDGLCPHERERRRIFKIAKAGG